MRKTTNVKLKLEHILLNSVRHSPNSGTKKASHPVCAKKPRVYVDEIDPKGFDLFKSDSKIIILLHSVHDRLYINSVPKIVTLVGACETIHGAMPIFTPAQAGF